MSTDRAQRAIRTVNALVTSALVTVSPAAYQALEALSLGMTGSAAVIFAGVVSLVLGTDALLRLSISSLQPLRRLIYGRQYIEGWWYDIAYDRANSEIREVAIIKINYESDDLRMDGILFAPTGQRIGNFSTSLTSFDGRDYRYIYRRKAIHSGVEEGEGYGEYQFTQEQPYPLSFTGSFNDPGVRVPVEIYGYRILKRKSLRRVKSNSHDAMTELVLEIAANFKDHRGVKSNFSAC